MIEQIRKQNNYILVAGNHIKIIQSILDFDYTSGRETPSIVGIISAGRKSQKFFWGDGEILIPVFSQVEQAKKLAVEPHWLLCITSASSTPKMVDAFCATFPKALGAHLFAEGVAERDALFLVEQYGQDKLFAGPSGVGLCVPGSLKLGAIGGILGPRVAELGSVTGHTAIICSSGGMVNELIYQVTASGGGISFAACYGGDRFPVTSPLQWFLEAEKDPETKEIIYFGELGGTDEYILRDAIKDGTIKKPVFAYIAGRFESKEEKIQFGHAKALAKAEAETAVAKMKALAAVGVTVSETFEDFMTIFSQLSRETHTVPEARNWTERKNSPKKTLFSAPQYKESTTSTFTEAILSRILGTSQVSHETVELADKIFTALIDHGPHVSGAVNAMITTRAGRDMSTALASGVLTIGDRFGGAVNNAAVVWQKAVSHGTKPGDLVSEYSKNRAYIPGIGHRKYSIYKPDPRLESLVSHGTNTLKKAEHTQFAKAVAEITSKKRANLILNVDGAIAALFMDYLVEKENYSTAELEELIDTGFFNALFIIPRSVGFVGNHLDQKRIDEGLFRLDESDSFNY